MIESLLGAAVLISLTILGLPLLMVLGPAAYAYRVMANAAGNEAGLGAAAFTLIYAVIVVWKVHSSFGLLICIVVVPWAIGALVTAGYRR